MLQMYLYST